MQITVNSSSAQMSTSTALQRCYLIIHGLPLTKNDYLPDRKQFPKELISFVLKELAAQYNSNKEFQLKYKIAYHGDPDVVLLCMRDPSDAGMS